VLTSTKDINRRRAPGEKSGLESGTETEREKCHVVVVVLDDPITVFIIETTLPVQLHTIQHGQFSRRIDAIGCTPDKTVAAMIHRDRFRLAGTKCTPGRALLAVFGIVGLMLSSGSQFYHALYRENRTVAVQ
jgi:hypothetical protein